MSQKKFLTSEDISQLFGIDESTLQNLVQSGDLKALADRGTWKFRREDIESLISSGRLQATRELPAVDDLDFDGPIEFAQESSAQDQLDFLELDEDALSEQSTVISTGLPQDLDELQLSFTEDPDLSSGDVHIFEPSESLASDSDILVRGSLSSELPEFPETVSQSDVTQIPESPQIENDPENPVDFLSSLGMVDEEPETTPATDRTLAEADAFIRPENPEVTEELSIVADDEFDIDSVFDQDTLEGNGESGITLETEDSGISLEAPDSGISLEAPDSGFSLVTEDSGISLDAGDSGISLEPDESGISLDAGDSGISLETGDSGISLESGSNDVISVAATDADMDLEDDFDFSPGAGDSKEILQLTPSSEFDEEDLLVGSGSNDDLTTVIAVDESSSDVGVLSGAIASGESVEDLEVSEHLEAAILSDDEFASAEEEEIIDAGDEAFSDEFEGETGDDEDVYAAPVAAKPREPSWGTMTAVLVIGAAGLVGLNTWLMLEGLNTMWSGEALSGPAASIVESIGGLIG